MWYRWRQCCVSMCVHLGVEVHQIPTPCNVVEASRRMLLPLFCLLLSHNNLWFTRRADYTHSTSILEANANGYGALGIWWYRITLMKLAWYKSRTYWLYIFDFRNIFTTSYVERAIYISGIRVQFPIYRLHFKNFVIASLTFNELRHSNAIWHHRTRYSLR